MHSFVSQLTVAFGTVLSVSVVTFSADYCWLVIYVRREKHLWLNHLNFVAIELLVTK